MIIIKWLYQKPPGMKYTDLCIYIDNNFYKEDCDYELCFKYMWILAVMLATKSKLFTRAKDYEDFAFELALSTYQRMIDKNKSQITSVLNYMKSIIVFRKMSFVNKRSQEIVDPTYTPGWDPVEYSSNYQEILESSNRERSLTNICDCIKDLHIIIKSNIPKVYRSDKATFRNLYISSLLTLINRFTLANSHLEFYNRKISSSSLNEVKFYSNYLDNKIILWHLDNSMSAVVTLIINKTLNYFAEEIKGMLVDMRISNEEFNNIIFSELGSDHEYSNN